MFLHFVQNRAHPMMFHAKRRAEPRWQNPDSPRFWRSTMVEGKDAGRRIRAERNISSAEADSHGHHRAVVHRHSGDERCHLDRFDTRSVQNTPGASEADPDIETRRGNKLDPVDLNRIGRLAIMGHKRKGPPQARGHVDFSPEAGFFHSHFGSASINPRKACSVVWSRKTS